MAKSKSSEPTTAAPEGAEAPAGNPVLDQLVAEKVAAGLSKSDAITCAKAQIAHDEELAAAAKAKPAKE